MKLKLLNLLLPLLAPLCSTAQQSEAVKVDMPDYSAYILTPAPAPAPRINSARIFGVRPGSPVIYAIAASGERPMRFEADNLPEGIALDADKGIITGCLSERGEYRITLRAVNALGSDERDLRIVVGDRIALTPPMGWNSWNCWGNSVSQEKVLASARAMVDKRLVDFGWTYINIDDGWQGRREGDDRHIEPNRKFPYMKALSEEIHAMGLKLGIYSGPWIGTYAGHVGTQCDNADGTYDWIEQGICNENYKYVTADDPTGNKVRREHYRHGRYSFAEVDARTWADWGVDYLKYDWKPNDYYYAKEMADALHATGRDIVYSLSNSAPFADAQHWATLAECWRTTGDIRDNWNSISKIGFDAQYRWAAFNSPGHWADADMLVVGMVGWGPNLHPTGLTPDEQFTHITLWTLLASPMLIGGDMSQLDDFTLSLLCNCEVNDVLQDPLGVRATPYYMGDDYVTYVKNLEDGSLAVGMFNRSDKPMKIGVIPRSLGLWSDLITVRDLWRQADVAEVGCNDRFEQTVAPHGVVFVRLSPGNTHERTY